MHSIEERGEKEKGEPPKVRGDQKKALKKGMALGTKLVREVRKEGGFGSKGIASWNARSLKDCSAGSMFSDRDDVSS